MKQFLRNRVSHSASYFEIVLTTLILLAVAMGVIEVLVSFAGSVTDLFHGSFTFNIHDYVSMVIELIIAIEFVKMISKHTAESSIEVLLIVIARKIVFDESAYQEIVLGVLAIGTLFVIKKYFTQKSNPEGSILEAGTSLKEMNLILGTNFTSEDGGNTVSELVLNLLRQEGRRPHLGLEIPFKDHLFKIYSIRNNEIDAIEVVPLTPKRSFLYYLGKKH